MAIEYLTVTLYGDDDDDPVKVAGKDLISGDKDDNQIVTVLDGGELSDDDDDEGIFVFEFWGKGSPTEPGAGPGGDDQFHFDLSGFDDDFSILIKSFDAGDRFFFTNFNSYTTVGNIWTFDYTGSDGNPHTVSINAESANGTGIATIVVCFARGTRIFTPTGYRVIEDLAEGDLVVCGDEVHRPIQWIGSRLVDEEELQANPDLRPVRLLPGSLGEDCPESELSLSPQHRVLLRDWRAELLFGETEVLVPATALINEDTIRPDTTCDEVEYFHILLDGHHTIFANGVECETLMPAEMAQTAMSAEARAEILTIFPELVTDLTDFGPSFRTVIKSYEAAALRGL